MTKKKRDINDKPFDEATLAKLDIFEDYAEAWIPTFVMAGYEQICIFDFFAGSGYDSVGVSGSPIRILKQIRKFIEHIFKKGTKITLFVNELKRKKFQDLKQACEAYFEKHPEMRRAVVIKYSNEDFDVIFTRLYPMIVKYPSLVYLDQNGVKFIADKYVLALEQTYTTDFLYFVSSSHFLRFGKTEEFKQYFNFDVEAAKKEPYKFIHRSLLKQLKDILPQDSKLHLYPFSLRKGANIHGIIFGATSIRAIDKFLDIAWRRAPFNGNANFDIEGEREKTQLDLFSKRELSKIEAFNVELKDCIKTKKIATNKEIFYYTLQVGHPRQHASIALRELKRMKLIDYQGSSPKIDYKYIKNDKDIIQIKWIDI